MSRLPAGVSPKQKKALELILERMDKGTFGSLKQCMLDAGYSETSAHNPKQNLLSRDGFKKLLAKYDMDPVLSNIYKIAKDNNDKRSAIQAAKLLIKVKDLMPKERHSVGVYEEQNRVFE